MSWIISGGLLVNRSKGKVLYPWQYELQWGISEKEVRFLDFDGNVITQCSEYEIGYKDLSKLQEEGRVWQGLQIEIDSDILPGSNTYVLVDDQLTNGTVNIRLTKCELSVVSDEHFGLTCNEVRYLVKNEVATQQHLQKLMELLQNALRGVAPSSHSSEATPGSSDFLRVVAWVYSLLSIGGGIFLAKEGAVAVGVGIGVSSFLVLAFALAVSTINDNLHKLTKRK
ncbi:hypothetical protein [Rheinheimera maricola]|uniref:Uncharacterized protein n=1 Tax=Rheinheimera maricola TaxID=2793282 RepID=A0ABS7X9D1_9GAMM|nr:hypothetical protein [Rheinheimera maricola]MBZ9612160.1 hypothetical protein [Rheinheimera maricola]